MHNLWLAFKCLSLIAGCLLMIAIIVAIVEAIRNTFKKKSYEQKIDEFVEKLIADSFKDEENKDRK